MSKKKQRKNGSHLSVVQPEAAKNKTAAPATLVPGQDSPQFLSLDPNTVLRLRMYEAETRAATSEGRLRISQMQSLLQQIDPEGKVLALQQQIDDFLRKKAAAEKNYLATILGIESKLGIKMKDYSYDDETGRLYPHNQYPAAPEVPALPPPPSA